MKKHPKALRVLIPTEMAETYAYFTLQAILVFYLMQALSLDDAYAYALSGQFIALAFITPLIGGWLADHLIGNRMAIWLGVLCLCSGYSALALVHQGLLLSLSLIIVGNGLLKPNLSSFMGEFYKAHDKRREGGFTLVYTGASISSLLAIGSVGYIREWFGWSACFAAAAFAMLLGISIYRFGFRYFNDKGFLLALRANKLKPFYRSKCSMLLWLSVFIALIFFAMKTPIFSNEIIYGFAVLFCFYVARVARSLDANSRRKLLALIILFAIATFYKAMFFETYLAVSVFTQRVVERSLFGHIIPATTFLSLSSFFTIILGPFFARMWQSKKINLSITFKFSLGLLIMGGGMQMLAMWITHSSQGMLPMASIIIFRLFFAVSELFILPIGLAMILEYAPKSCISLMMGGWYLTAAFGGKLAGVLATFADVPQKMTDIIQIKQIYHHAFENYALLNFTLFILCMMLIPLINKLLDKGEAINEAEIKSAQRS